MAKQKAKQGPVITYSEARRQQAQQRYGSQAAGPAAPPPAIDLSPAVKDDVPVPEEPPAERKARTIAKPEELFCAARQVAGLEFPQVMMSGPAVAAERRTKNAVAMADACYAAIMEELDETLLMYPDTPEHIYSFAMGIPEDVISYVVKQLQEDGWRPEYGAERCVRIQLPIVSYIAQPAVPQHISKIQPL